MKKENDGFLLKKKYEVHFSEEEKRGLYRSIYERRDIRTYLPDSPDENTLMRILDAAHHAPSVGFMQPWNFILIRDLNLRKKVYEHFRDVTEKAAENYSDDRNLKYRSLKLQGILDAPLNILVTCSPERGGKHVLGRATIRETDIYSTCLAVENLWLAARAEGIGMGWMSLYEPSVISEIFSLPEGVIPVAYLTAGYAVEFPEEPLLSAVGWRKRLNLNNVLYRDSWGNEYENQHPIENAGDIKKYEVMKVNEIKITKDEVMNADEIKITGDEVMNADEIKLTGEEIMEADAGVIKIEKASVSVNSGMNSSDVTLSSSEKRAFVSANNSRDRLDQLLKPQGSLGFLEKLLIRLGNIQNKVIPDMNEKSLVIFAADHGITEEGVSAYPGEITAKMVYQFLSGGGAVNSIARQNGINLFIADLGVNHDFENAGGLIHAKQGRGTRNFIKDSAMTVEEAKSAIEAGRNIVRQLKKPDVLCLGEMGIGNTTSAAALACAVMDKSPEEIAGRGTGIGPETYRKKVDVIQRGLNFHKSKLNSPIGILSSLGGFEIAGMTGAILECRRLNIPVLLDGFITGSAALLAHAMNPEVTDILFAGHKSFEKGHALMLDYLKLEPILNLDMRLGEGSGAALAVNILENSVRIMRELKTFEELGLPNPKIPDSQR